MFMRLWARWALLDEAGGDGGAGGGGPAAAPAAAAPAPAATGTPAAPAATTTGAVNGMPKSALSGDAPPGDAPPGEQPADAPKPDDGQPKPEDQPVTYEKFNLPEGVTVDDEKLKSFTDIVGSAKVSQDVAQQLVDLYTSELAGAVDGARQAAMNDQVKAWVDLNKQWSDQAKADPVIGGANFDKNLGAMKTAMNAVLGEDAKDFFAAMDVYGSGTNHPTILKGLFKMLQVHMPSSPVAGNKPAGEQKTAGATLYPTQAKLGNGYEG